MDLASVRNLFGNDAIGEAAANGQPIVTALSLRSAIVPAVMDEAAVNARRAYGPASNRAFMEIFLRLPPIMRQFCIFSCNRGVFSGNLATTSVPKMAQLLSRIRLMRAGTIQDLNKEGQAMYQAYAAAELFGPHIPDEYRLNEAAARTAIIDAVYDFYHSEGFDIEDTWFNEHLGLGENAAACLARTKADTTIDMALILLEAWTATLETSKEWLNGISMLTVVFTSLSKQGSLTAKAAQKIITGVKNDFAGQNIFLPERTVRVFYVTFSSHVNEENAEAMFNHYSDIAPAESVRLLTLITQAADSGMTVYQLIHRALNEQPDFPYWEAAAGRFPGDFANFIEGIAAVNNNRYYGFKRNLGLVAANRFRSLGYLSQQILVKIGGDDPLDKYGGLKSAIPGKDWIDRVIEIAQAADVNAAVVNAPNAAAQAVYAQARAALAGPH